MPKKAFRRVLTGADPLLVDDLLRITQILDLDPEQMGVPEGIDDENMLGDEALGSDSTTGEISRVSWSRPASA